MENDLIQISGIFSALFLGLILGFKHSTDGDHVVAVSTMAKNFKNIFKSLWVGVSWGLGHSTPLLILGTLILFIKESLMEFYESVATYFEFGVAIMLVLLGMHKFSINFSTAVCISIHMTMMMITHIFMDLMITTMNNDNR